MREKILARFLNCSKNQIFRSEYGYNIYTDMSTEYLVLTEKEANNEAKRHVWSFIFTFDYDFLNSHLALKLPEEKLAELISKGHYCCQQIFTAFIPDYERFLDEAIRKYGRPYFLCFDDKTEYRVVYRGREYCVYRLV